MINRYCSISASSSLGRERDFPISPAPFRGARGRLTAVLAAALLSFAASPLAAQKPFTEAPGSPWPVGTSPVHVALGDFDGDRITDIAEANLYGEEISVLPGDGKGGFSPARNFPAGTGSMQTSLAVGDFNQDGKADLLVGHRDTGPTLLRGDGAGSLTAILSDIPGTSNGGSDSLVTGDFNGDSKSDIASVGKTGLSVLLGNGTGKFKESFSLAIPYAGKAQLLSLHVDGDLLLDLAVSTPASVTVLKGDGTGKFTEAPGSPYAAGGGSIVTGDFNADYRRDLAVAGPGGVTVLLRDRNYNDVFTVPLRGPFAPETGSPDASLAVGDFNADGKQDLAVTNSLGNNVVVLTGDGNGNFEVVAAPVDTGILPASLATADFNGDGRPDLAVANTVSQSHPGAQGSVTILLLSPIQANPGSLTFYARAGYAAPAPIPASVATPAPGLSYTATSNQPWLKVDGASEITSDAAAVMVSVDQTSLAAGTHSGSIQIAAPGVAGSSIAVTFHVANPSGTLKTVSSPVTGSNPVSVAVADFNGDGKQDLASADWGGNTVTVLLGDVAGGFTAASTLAVGSKPASVVAGDFNRDGKPDLAVASHEGSYPGSRFSVLLGDGSGNFTRYRDYVGGCALVSLAVGDFNGDGRQDLALQDGGNDEMRPSARVALGDGAGGFFAGGCLSAAGNVSIHGSVAVGDFNGDGNQDMAAVRADSGDVKILLGHGRGDAALGIEPDFTEVPGPTLAGTSSGFVVVADFNADGKQDLAVGDTRDGITLALGNGMGEFTAAPGERFLPFAEIRSLSVGDFDGDGTPDLAAVYAGGFHVLLGDGTGRFPRWSDFAPLPLDSTLPLAAASGDFNADGKADFAVPASSGGHVSVLLGDAVSTVSSLHATPGTTVAFGTPIRLTLLVSGVTQPFAPPSGSVTLYDGETPLMTLAGTTDKYVFEALNLAPGTHTLTARYGGNARSVGSTSNTVSIEVRLGNPVGSAVSSGTGAASPFNSPGLAQNEMLVSPNGKYAAVMHSDGNFVIYAQGSAIWSTQTQGKGRAPYRLAVQPDGNLLIYGSSETDVNLPGFGVCNANSACIAIWSTRPLGGQAPYTLKMQDDGNLVMYDGASRAVWASWTQER
ncbi:MAG: VCBS repeat-containing protein [Bryobacterales bacterium]|nr:VCBS repeat-containing protein [Bryobacterales bacterium]